MALRNLIKQALGFGVIAFLSKTIRLFLVPIYTRYLTPENYGLLDLVLVTMATLSLFGGNSINYAVGTMFYDKEEIGYRKKLISTGLWLLSVLSIIASLLFFYGFNSIIKLVVFVGGKNSGGQLIPIEIVVLMALIFPTSALLTFVAAVFRIKQDLSKFLILGIPQTIISAIGSILAVVLSPPHLRVINIFVVQLISQLVLLAYGLWLLREYLAPVFSRLLAVNYIKIGIPLLPNSASFIGKDLFNRYYLATVSLAAVGMFGVASKIPMLIQMAAQPIMMAWGPWALSIKNQENAEKNYRTALSIGYSAWIWLTILTVLWGKTIFTFAVGRDFHPAWTAIAPNCIAACFLGLAQLQQLDIHLSKQSWKLALASGLSLLVNVIAVIVVITLTKSSYNGLSWGLCIGNIALFAATFALSHRYNHLNLDVVVQMVLLIFAVMLAYVIPRTCSQLAGIAVNAALTFALLTFIAGRYRMEIAAISKKYFARR